MKQQTYPITSNIFYYALEINKWKNLPQQGFRYTNPFFPDLIIPNPDWGYYISMLQLLISRFTNS